MMTEGTAAPRCSRCDHVLPSFGAICHACDVELHFEGALRTAPPLSTFTRQSDSAQQQQEDLRAS